MILLTGFLGAGKTTVLNRVLAAQHHRRVAVLVNELGRVDVDAGMIRARAGDVVELSGGCVCHQIGVQRELWSALDDVVRRSRPEVVILETTGIAEPGPILDGLERRARRRKSDYGGGADDERRAEAAVRAAGVVTVVEAEAGPRCLEQHGEAREQVLAADRILISKTDLVSPPHLAEVHRRLHELNPEAERASFPPTAEATATLIPWLLEPRPRTRATRGRTSTAEAGTTKPGAGARAAETGHAHQIAAATFVDDAPLVADALLLACEALGPRLLRAKGFVHVAGDPRRAFLERAGDRTLLVYGDAWGDEPRVTRLVLIGTGLDDAALRRRLWACRAGLTAN